MRSSRPDGPRGPLEVRGPRLTFRRFSEEAITPEYLGWLNDTELMRFSRQRRHVHTIASSRAFALTVEETNGYFWSIQRTADLLRIGTLTMYCNVQSKVADFGILIGHPNARGSGFGREACGMAIAFLFEVANMRRVTAGTLAPNVAMNACARSCGMVLEGVLREHETAGLSPEVPVDVNCYGILRSEWEALPQRIRIETK